MIRIVIVIALAVVSELQGQVPLRTRSIELQAPSSNTITLAAPANVIEYSLTLPSMGGPAGALLSTDGNQRLSWTRPQEFGWTLSGNAGIDSLVSYLGSTDEQTGQPLAFRTDGVERARITGGSGFLGIGTTQPTAQLHVRGSLSAPAFRVRAAPATSSNIIVAEDEGGTQLLALGATGNLTIGSVLRSSTTVLVDGGLALQSATINIGQDNQVVPVGNRSILILTSSDLPNNRTVLLGDGVQQGQIVYLVAISTPGNGVELLDSINGANANLSGAWIAENGDTIQLVWSGGLWLELGRSNN